MTSVIGFSIIHAAPAGDWIFIISRQIDALIFSRADNSRVYVCLSVYLYVCVLKGKRVGSTFTQFMIK